MTTQINTKRILSPLVAAMLILSAAGCSNLNSKEQRALSGGAIGAGAGALFGAMTGGGAAAGALIGGAGGAAIGALTDDDDKK